VNKNSRKDSNRREPSGIHGDAQGTTGLDRLSQDAVELINRALFEEWLQRHGSWNAFLEAAQRPGKPDSKKPPTRH
jgi:hypothetical protein